MTKADLPTLAEWLARPHVSQWWDSAATLADFSDTMADAATGHGAALAPADDSAATPYFACRNGQPIGFIQSYVATSTGAGWWPNECDAGVRGIDQFLADEHCLGQGLGTQMVRDFAGFLFQDPTVTRIQADPNPSNARAIRCYEKAGFRKVGIVTTPDGPALLMVMDRSTTDRGTSDPQDMHRATRD